jgi:hypothetical protein
MHRSLPKFLQYRFSRIARDRYCELVFLIRVRLCIVVEVVWGESVCGRLRRGGDYVMQGRPFVQLFADGGTSTSSASRHHITRPKTHHGVAHTANNRFWLGITEELTTSRDITDIASRRCLGHLVCPQLLPAQLACRLQPSQRIRLVWPVKLARRSSDILLVKEASSHKHYRALRPAADSMDCRAHGKVQPDTGAWPRRPGARH